MIAPYSLRSTRRPRVAAPLSWEEVEEAASADDPDALRFGPREVLDRMGGGLDPFADAVSVRQRL